MTPKAKTARLYRTKLFLSITLGAFIIGGISIVSPDDAFAERKRAETKEKKRKRKYVHPCPGGTEQFGSAPPDARKVYCRQQVHGGYRIHGNFSSWHQNGEKRLEGEYHKGKRHGVWKSYHRNGQKKYVEEWNGGKRVKRTNFDKEGNPTEEKDRRAIRNEKRAADSWRYDTDNRIKKRKRRAKKSSWAKGSRTRRVKLFKW